MDEETQEELDLKPLVSILSDFDFALQMVDDFPTETSLDLRRTLMCASRVKTSQKPPLWTCRSN